MHGPSLYIKRPWRVVALAVGILAGAGPATADVCLDEGTVYPTTTGPGESPPFSVLACDVNGDNNADLITANDGDDTISVLINNGDGTFAAPIRLLVGDNAEETIEPVAVACCDVDGDDLVDLVTVNHASDDISVLLNEGLVEETLQFATPLRFAVGEAPWGISCVKVDSDEHVDIVTANFTTDDVSVLLNTGTGSFDPAYSYAVGDGPKALATCDIDGDSDLDIITANFGGQSISVLRNGGSGNFAAVGDFALEANPFGIACCDLDGVQEADVVTANLVDDSVTVLFNAGNGTYGQPARYAGVDGAAAVACGDLDGDLTPDVVTANLSSDDLGLLLNTGTGTLREASLYAVGTNASSVQIADLAAGDDLDVTVAFADGVRVFVNDCAATCGDGACGGAEDPCNCPEDCGLPDSCELPASTCADGWDNDCDGCIDEMDTDCGGQEASCRNGIDDDCDGLLDCSDPDCACGDLDSDGDSDVDLLDVAAFQVCFGAAPVPLECATMDSNSDEEIDLADFAKLVELQSGPQGGQSP